MRRYLAYLWYVLRHKWFVFIEGRKLGVSLWQLIIHDWSKFSPDEFIPYAKAFYKPNGKGQYDQNNEFITAWARHQWRQPHHWQNWVVMPGGTPIGDLGIMIMDMGMVLGWEIDGRWEQQLDISGLRALPMPERFRKEMLADWRGAGRSAKGGLPTREWYLKRRDIMILHPETRRWIEEQLVIPR